MPLLHLAFDHESWSSMSRSLQSLSSSGLPRINRNDFAPSGESSSIGSSWGSENDYDYKSTEQIYALIDSLASFLYSENPQSPPKSILQNECQEWMRHFSHLRIRGIKNGDSRELSYESIQRPQIRSKSPYFQIPDLCNTPNHPLVLNGISLSSACFTSSDNESNITTSDEESDCDDYALNYPIDWQSPHLEAAYQTLSQPQTKSHWFLMNYYAQEEYVEEEDGGKTPTPHDPHIKRRTRKVYSTEICGSGADGLEGLKSYVSSQKESDGFIFAFLTLPDSKWGPSTVFLSWTSSSPNVLPIRRLCIMDIKPAFQSSSVWLLYTQQGDRRSLLELSGPKLESVLKPVTKNVDKCDFPSIIQQDGEVIEWFAVDTGHLNDTDSSSHKSTRHTDDLTPQESILQEVESQLFDEFWSEIPSLLSPVLRSLVQFKTKKPSRASSIQLSSSRMDPPQELHTNENDDDISIFDTMQIDELMKGPNLCSAMTIKPVPLQKRDGMGKLRVLPPDAQSVIHDSFLPPRPSSAKRLPSRPLGLLRPTSARFQDATPAHPRLHSAAGFRPSQHSLTKRPGPVHNGTGHQTRLVPLSSLSIAHSAHLSEVVFGTGIGFKSMTSHISESKTPSQFNQVTHTPRKLPPIRSSGLLEESQARTSRHVAFEMPEDLGSVPRPVSAKRQPSAHQRRPLTLGIQTGGNSGVISRPHTAMGNARTPAVATPSFSCRFPSKFSSMKDESALHPVMGMRAFVGKGYRRRV